MLLHLILIEKKEKTICCEKTMEVIEREINSD